MNNTQQEIDLAKQHFHTCVKVQWIEHAKKYSAFTTLGYDYQEYGVTREGAKAILWYTILNSRRALDILIQNSIKNP